MRAWTEGWSGCRLWWGRDEGPRDEIRLRLRLLGRLEIVLTCNFGGKLVVKLVVELL